MNKIASTLFGTDRSTPVRDQRLLFGIPRKRLVYGGVALLLIVVAAVIGFSLVPRANRPGSDATIATGTTAQTAATATSTGAAATPAPASAAVKNLVFLLSDGMGPASMTLARTVGMREQLNLDAFLCGTSRTRSADALITDSAAGATAYASASKSYNGAIGVDANKELLATLFEVAQRRGMAVGVVVTSRVTDATPAAFTAHATYRDFQQFIAAQQFNMSLDVLLGGGRGMFAGRADGRDLLAEMAATRNVTVFADAAQFRAFTADLGTKDVRNTKIAALWTPGHMSYQVDRAADEPTLAEMSKLALELLSRKSPDKGFVLLIEGSRIDMAAHDNDASTQVYETLGFDDAFGVVRDFVKREPNTLVVSTSDHETGGLTLGIQSTPLGQRAVYDWFPARLRAAKRSAFATANLIFQAGADVATLVREYVGTEITDADVQRYVDLKANGTSAFLIMLNLGNDQARRSLLGFATTGHTGVDVNVYALGAGAERFRGNLENIEIGKRMAQALGLYDELLAHTAWLRANSTLDLNSAAAHMKREDDHQPIL